MAVIIIIVILAAFFGLFAWALVAKRKRQEAMATLASQQGWTALANDTSLAQYLPTYLQGLGRQWGIAGNTRRTEAAYDMAYQATVASRPVVFFQYEYTEFVREYDPATETSQEQAYSYFFIVLHASLPASFTNILLLQRSFLSKLKNFGEHSGLQQIRLEGDFNKTFDTYIAPNSQVEALSLLTPDVMQQMMNIAPNPSLQVNGPSLFVSLESKYLTPDVIQPLLQNVAALLAKIESKASVQLAAAAPAPPPPAV
jgi:hypothetical protein